MNQNEINGIGIIIAGLFGLFAFVSDWMLYQAIGDIAFEVVFLAVIAFGIYLMGRKKVTEIDKSPVYASSF